MSQSADLKAVSQVECLALISAGYIYAPEEIPGRAGIDRVCPLFECMRRHRPSQGLLGRISCGVCGEEAAFR
jgi:hypothetical protein